MAKIRLDLLMVKQGLAMNQSEATKLVMAGYVYHQHIPLNKPGMSVLDDIELNLKLPKNHQWASRGGIKLEHAIKYFNLDINDKICLDIGCSTGGFTDVLLNYHAKKVYAVDVAYGEIAWKLRHDPRVVLFERFNAKNLSIEYITDNIDVIVCDVSFISSKSVLLPSFKLIANKAYMISLIKPQFEAERSDVPKGGVIIDDIVHQDVCNDIKQWMIMNNWQVIDIIESPIKGKSGNKEFLLGAMYG